VSRDGCFVGLLSVESLRRLHAADYTIEVRTVQSCHRMISITIVFRHPLRVYCPIEGSSWPKGTGREPKGF
jgi:hypothetical protein